LSGLSAATTLILLLNTAANVTLMALLGHSATATSFLSASVEHIEHAFVVHA
jgi:hypothetical protein